MQAVPSPLRTRYYQLTILSNRAHYFIARPAAPPFLEYCEINFLYAAAAAAAGDPRGMHLYSAASAVGGKDRLPPSGSIPSCGSCPCVGRTVGPRGDSGKNRLFENAISTKFDYTT